MQLLTAHKILISSAIVMFVFYGFVQLGHYLQGDTSALWQVLFAVVSTLGLSFYLRWVWSRRPGSARSSS